MSDLVVLRVKDSDRTGLLLAYLPLPQRYSHRCDKCPAYAERPIGHMLGSHGPCAQPP